MVRQIPENIGSFHTMNGLGVLDALSEEKITNMIEKYLKDKTYVIVTHRPRIKALCNKHYKFEQHMMKEIIDV